MHMMLVQQVSFVAAILARLAGESWLPSPPRTARMGIDPIRAWLVTMLDHGHPEASDSAGILLAARIRQLQVLSPPQALKDPKWTKL